MYWCGVRGSTLISLASIVGCEVVKRDMVFFLYLIDKRFLSLSIHPIEKDVNLLRQLVKVLVAIFFCFDLFICDVQGRVTDYF